MQCLQLYDAAQEGLQERERERNRGLKRHVLKVSTTQVNSVHVNPVDSNLLLTGSNDWTARLADLRCLTSAASEPDSGKVPYLMH